jgi:hypothetical protein
VTAIFSTASPFTNQIEVMADSVAEQIIAGNKKACRLAGGVSYETF